ncbi:hypothetical protein C6568_11365 [Melaminivora suipulveris]|uniref:Uncharacterized protein n=1 Tax=Melaminivora suipulveris TaxID=2109913 RepID=A0A2R3QDD0_9BURK|nr:hypothetical protein [Melaminivora suipulveris]AVO49786.1 hypothetical protein C6568_11365 [Melaminivora suipulveris]
MTATPVVHPRTLLGAARLLLSPGQEPAQQHLQARAARALGYHAHARSLWEALAAGGDADALRQLACMADGGAAGAAPRRALPASAGAWGE